MESVPSLFAPQPGAPASPGPSASAAATTRGDELFRREVERAAERNGGRERVEERLAADRALRRERRRAGFAEEREERRDDAQRPARARRDQDGGPEPEALALSRPAAAAPARRSAEPLEHIAPALLPAAPPASQGEAPAAAVGAIPGVARAPSAPSPAASTAPAALLPAAAAPAAATAAAPRAALVPNAAGSASARANEVEAEQPAQRPAPQAPAEPEPDRSVDLLRQIRLHFAGGASGAREALLHLSPPELGRLLVRLSVKNGRVGAVVRGESAQALALFERHLPELRAALGEQGVEFVELKLELGLERRSTDRSGDRSGRLDDAGGAHEPEQRAARLELSPALLSASSALGVARERGVDTYA